MSKRYSELIKLPTYEERLDYLRTFSRIGLQTFGGHRYLNQALYTSHDWKMTKREIIIRDDGCDLALPDYPIFDKHLLFVHHIEPITIEDIIERRPCVLDPENLICVSLKTHNAIHYSHKEDVPPVVLERSKDDTTLWK